jgi:hypothetical protein
MNLRNRGNECLTYIASLGNAISNFNNTKKLKLHLNKQVLSMTAHETLSTKV